MATEGVQGSSFTLNLEIAMGEVVDMTGRVVVADEHPLGVESVRDVSI